MWKDVLAVIGGCTVVAAVISGVFIAAAHRAVKETYVPKPCTGFFGNGGCHHTVGITEDSDVCLGHRCLTHDCGNPRLDYSCRCAKHHIEHPDDSHFAYKNYLLNVC